MADPRLRELVVLHDQTLWIIRDLNNQILHFHERPPSQRSQQALDNLQSTLQNEIETRHELERAIGIVQKNPQQLNIIFRKNGDTIEDYINHVRFRRNMAGIHTPSPPHAPVIITTSSRARLSEDGFYHLDSVIQETKEILQNHQITHESRQEETITLDNLQRAQYALYTYKGPKKFIDDYRVYGDTLRAYILGVRSRHFYLKNPGGVFVVPWSSLPQQPSIRPLQRPQSLNTQKNPAQPVVVKKESPNILSLFFNIWRSCFQRREK